MATRKRKQKIKRRTVRIKGKNTTIFVGGDEKCIFVPLHDGLGNQLFVYAAALVAKKALNLPLCTLPAKMSGHSSKNYRTLLFTNTKPVNSSDPVIKQRMNASTKVLTKLTGVHTKWVNTNIVANRSKNVILPSTYFQNYDAIKGIIPEMRTKILDALKSQCADLNATIDSGSSAFMHVRKGDYDKFGQGLDKNYYQNALNELSKIGALKTVYVFSNNLDWCKQQGFTCEGKAIEMKDEPDELRVLYMMSQCHCAAIISASTFSLWGAIFGAATATKPVIIYPKHWFLSGNSSALELPKEEQGWISMKTS
jgi:hypothetical protein